MRMQRYIGRLLFAFWVLLLASLPNFVYGQEDTEQVEPTLWEEVVYLTNLARQAEGHPPLAINNALVDAALAHASDMGQMDFFAHDNPETFTSADDRIKAAGYDGIAFGENIAAGSQTAEDVVEQWLNSPGHRRNMMSPNFREIGVARYVDAADEYPSAAGAYGVYWVQTFGTSLISFPVVINAEAFSASSHDVKLHIYGDGWAEEMRLRNGEGSFSAWEPYQSERAWRLPDSTGFHTVFVELRRNDEVVLASDDIYLDPNRPSPDTDLSIATDSLIATSISNQFIQAALRADGRFVLGTTEGNSTTRLDDNQPLLFGYLSNPETTSTFLRTTRDGVLEEATLHRDALVISPAVLNEDGLQIGWRIREFVIEQTINLVNNPFSGREDVALISYEITNEGDTAGEIDLGLLLDLQIGNNNAPFLFLPKAGVVLEELFLIEDEIPSYWRALENLDHSEEDVQAIGILSSGAATTPDQLRISRWDLVTENPWISQSEVELATSEMLNRDRVLSLSWLGRKVNPAETIQIATYYGVSDAGGGKAWLDLPSAPDCDSGQLIANLWINNNTEADFINGKVNLALPEGVLFAADESQEKEIDQVEPSSAVVLTWRLVTGEGASGKENLDAFAIFENGTSELTASSEVNLDHCFSKTVEIDDSSISSTATIESDSSAEISAEPTLELIPTLTPVPTMRPLMETETIQESLTPPFWECFPWWLLVPIIVLILLILLIWLTPLGRWLDEKLKSKTNLCKALAILTLLYSLFLIALIAREGLANLCQIDQVYFWRIAEGEPNGIYTTEFGVGGNPEAVAAINSASSCVGCHTISNSSNRIAAVQEGFEGDLIVQDLNGEDVPIPSIRASYMAWSPEGERLAVSLNDRDIAVVDIRDGSIVPVKGASQAGVVETMPTWSPDGQTIVFVRVEGAAANGSQIEAPSDIYAVPFEGGEPSPVAGASGEGFNYYPTYSPDGRWLAFTHHTSGETSYGDDASDIFLVPATGGERSRLTSNSIKADSWPTWSQDSQWLAFNTNRVDEKYDIYVTKIDENGDSGAGVPLPGANGKGVFEHLPSFAPPAQLDPLVERLLALWPWLIPLLLLLGLMWWLCRDLKPLPPEPPVIHYDPPRRPVQPPSFLDRWIPQPIWDPIPTLVIGVGGTGRHVLTQVKKNLRDAGAGQIDSTVQLLLVDTTDYELLNGEVVPIKFAGVMLDPDSEVVELGNNLNPLLSQYSSNADLPRNLKDWFPLNYYQRVGRGNTLDLTQGTGGLRPPVRAALIQKIDQEGRNNVLIDRLNQAVSHVRHEGRVRIIIAGSTAGGTGSALFNDIAFIARKVADDSGAEGVSVEGFAVTSDAFAAVNRDRSLQANSFTALRETERFQLTQGRAFEMRYKLSDPSDQLLVGQVNDRLFDELYLFDGHRADRPLGNEKPEDGVFATIADSVTFLLDKASRGQNIGQRRQDMQGLTNREQGKSGQLVVGTLGTFSYRLPVFDLIEWLKVRYALEMLRLFLIGVVEGDLHVSADLADEPGVSSDKELVAKFLEGRAGYAGADEMTRFIGGIALKGWSSNMLSELDKISGGDDILIQRNFKRYLQNTVLTLLNGQEGSDLFVARTAKLGFTVQFVSEVADYLQRAQEDLSFARVSRIGKEDDSTIEERERALDRAKDHVSGFAEESKVMLESLQTQIGLISYQLRGANSQSWRQLKREAEGLYEWLLTYQTEVESWRSQMEHSLVREYLQGDGLLDRWYKTYFSDSDDQRELLSRFFWDINQDGVPTLTLRTNEDVALTAEGLDKFGQHLLDLIGRMASEIWENETLSKVLEQTALHPESIGKTGDKMWQNSGPLLRYRPELANLSVESGYVGMRSDTIEGADSLRNSLAGKVPSDRSLLSVDITDPYSIILVRTADVLPKESLTFLADTVRAYDASDVPQAVFAAEAEAVRLENRIASELRETPRKLTPAVVTGLNQPERARLYAAVFASGWIEIINKRVVLRLPHTEPLELCYQPDDVLNPAVLGLIYFGAWHNPADVDRCREVIDSIDKHDQVADIWRKWTNEQWRDLDYAHQLLHDDSGRDLSVVVRLYIRDLLLALNSGS